MHKLSEIKIRYIVIILLFSGIGSDSMINLFYLFNDTIWSEILKIYYSTFVSLAFILFIFWKKRLHFDEVVGTFNSRNLPFSFEVAIFNIIISYSTIYILFYPLSFIYPSYIYEWLNSGAVILYVVDGRYPLLPNFLMFILVVVIIPIIEEVVFRGILINRLSVTFKTKTAVIISSILFGVLHTDPLGATIFGIIMAVIYIKTQGLIVPIICHALNNLVAYILFIGSHSIYGSQINDSILAFQDSWLVGLTSIITLIILSLIYFKRGQLYNKLYV